VTALARFQPDKPASQLNSSGSALSLVGCSVMWDGAAVQGRRVVRALGGAVILPPIGCAVPSSGAMRARPKAPRGR
jgi:hypothetical protein